MDFSQVLSLTGAAPSFFYSPCGMNLNWIWPCVLYMSRVFLRMGEYTNYFLLEQKPFWFVFYLLLTKNYNIIFSKDIYSWFPKVTSSFSCLCQYTQQVSDAGWKLVTIQQVSYIAADRSGYWYWEKSID